MEIRLFNRKFGFGDNFPPFVYQIYKHVESSIRNYLVTQLSKLTATLLNCIERLREASNEFNSTHDYAFNLASASSPSERRKEKKNEDEEFLPNNKVNSKIVSWQKNNGKCNGDFDMKTMLRKKLLKIRPKPPVNAFISYVQPQKDRIAQENPKKSIA